MSDDPREILKAAGVECAEVEALSPWDNAGELYTTEDADAAILALARLVEQFKWQRDKAADDLANKGEVLNALHGRDTFAKDYGEVVFDLDRRWKEHNA